MELLGDNHDNIAALFGYLRDSTPTKQSPLLLAFQQGSLCLTDCLCDSSGGEKPAFRHRFKLMLAGPTMAGKTSLLDAMRRGKQVRLADADTERTIGMAIELVLSDRRARGGGPLRGNAFDAGGHEEYQHRASTRSGRCTC